MDDDYDVTLSFSAALGDVLNEFVAAFLEVEIVAVAVDVCSS